MGNVNILKYENLKRIQHSTTSGRICMIVLMTAISARFLPTGTINNFLTLYKCSDWATTPANIRT